MFWYEYNSQLTAPVTPSEEFCVSALKDYLKDYKNFEFTTEWFDDLKSWPAW